MSNYFKEPFTEHRKKYFERYFSKLIEEVNDEEFTFKITKFKEDLFNGFTLYKKRYLEGFIRGYKDIEDFTGQFIKLYEYGLKNGPSSMTKEKFCLLYGNKIGTEKYLEKQNKNPFKNHKGKLSPFHKGSVNYSLNAIKKASENRSYTTRLDYYLNKGFSLEEAYKLLKNRQTTFSLKKCIEKLGKEEGIKRWKQRQEKWLDTLSKKSVEEKRLINFKKSTGKGNIKSKNCLLYYIKFFNDKITRYKIGITSRTLEKRFNFQLLKLRSSLDYEILFVKECKSVDEAYEMEQYILDIFFNKRIYTNYKGLKTTETFTEDVLKGFYG